LPNNTTVYTFAWIQFRRAGQQGPIRTLTLGKNSVNSTGRNEGLELEFAVLGSAGLAKGRVGYSISPTVPVCILNQPFKNSSIQSAGMLTDAGMLTRLAGHEVEARKSEAQAQKFF